MKTAIFASALAIGISAAAAQDAKNPEILSCTVIKTAAQLQAINATGAKKAGSYCLGNDIDLSSIPNWTPIGDASDPPTSAFRGHFDGNGHVIKNLKITANADGYYGLFGVVSGGVIENVGVTNENIAVTPAAVGYVGGLVGILQALDSPIYLSNVYSTGVVTCNAGTCAVGGLSGYVGSNATLTDAWSSADVTGSSYIGGLAGTLSSDGSYFTRIYATGNVTGGSASTFVGGLTGQFSSSSNKPSYMTQAYATGRVTGGTSAKVGGLIGYLQNTAAVQGAYATGAVSGGASAAVGGLIGEQSDAILQQVFATGAVSGGMTHGGLIGSLTGSPTTTNAYWDRVTSGQTNSAAGVTRTTAQLRANLPSGFTLGWGITKTVSYPYLSTPDNFSSTLATLVSSNVVFTFLPLQQTDKAQYIGNPAHADQASLATVYTMIGRSIGTTDNVGTLRNVKIDKYYWHDATQTTTFSGPITTHATLGPMLTLAAGAKLDNSNVVGVMAAHRLVILRGNYTKPGGSSATHYMLGTLYTTSGNSVRSVVANDPFTGKQIEISPTTRKVITPGFPLPSFVVNGYQQVTSLN